MVQTMYSANGIGLAAPQIGVPLRIFIVDLSVGQNVDDLITFVNPILVKEEGTQLEEEGCLSLPGFNSKITRPEKVIVTGLNREGNSHTIEATGLMARAFQHEMDHLDGRLFVDHLSRLKRDMILRKLSKMRRADGNAIQSPI